MEGLLLLLLPLLACPLAMAAMGGIAWTWAKLRGSRAQDVRGTQPEIRASAGAPMH